MAMALSVSEREETHPGAVALWRLYFLRAAYLLIVVGLGVQVWPNILGHAPLANPSQGVVRAVLAGVSLMALIGLRYPLKMLPLLFFETTWKAIWLIVVAWPAWTAHTIDADMADNIVACAMGAIFPVVIPWGMWRRII